MQRAEWDKVTTEREEMMSRLACMGVLVLLCACASGGATTTRGPSTPIDGTYDYVANIPGGQQVRGVMRFMGDTVLVEPVSEYCRPSLGATSQQAIRYECNGIGTFEQLQLWIDRRNPVQLSRWSATFRVQKRREVCVRYEVRAGRQVCVETSTETYETSESQGGRLQLTRKP